MSRGLARHLAGLPPARVLYTDLDGTLLGADGSLLTAADGRPSARAAQALVDAAAAGIAVVPVSGGQRAQLAHDARLLGLGSYIAEAGGSWSATASCATSGASARATSPTPRTPPWPPPARWTRCWPGSPATCAPMGRGTAGARRATCCTGWWTWTRRGRCSPMPGARGPT